MGKLSLVVELENLLEGEINGHTEHRLALHLKHPGRLSAWLVSVDELGWGGLALTSRLRRLGGLLNATMGCSGNISLRRSDICMMSMCLCRILLS